MNAKRSKTSPKTVIETAHGKHEAVEPVIISASRSTDIPAFFAPWLIDRFRVGYIRWVNPFNRRDQFVSLARTRAIVFWSKNPCPLLDHLEAFTDINWYLTYTINDYLRENLEPCLPPLTERIDTFRRFVDRIGPDRVIWRADPLLLINGLGVSPLLERIHAIAAALRGLTRRLVFSFADIFDYRKVQVNLDAAGAQWRDWDITTMAEAATGLSAIGREFGLEVQTCAEKASFDHLGITHGRCIDGDLLHRLFPNDIVLNEFLGFTAAQPSLFSGGATAAASPPTVRGSSPSEASSSGITPTTTIRHPLKDKGQRAECGCIVSKDIGRYDTCGHGCVYCYANVSPTTAARNMGLHDPTGDSVMP